MRLAIFSDVHGNNIALDEVLTDIYAQGGADMIWCLGDLAAFGPQPAACVQRVRQLADSLGESAFQVIGGNTDRYLVTGERPRFPAAADDTARKNMIREWRFMNDGLLWAADQLTFEDYQFLLNITNQELSLPIDGFGTIIGYHAVPGNDEAFLTPESTDDQACDLLSKREGRVAIGGHIHRQFDRTVDGWRILNSGSVGMPFDVKGQAAWAMLTIEGDQLTVDLRRLPFDVDSVIADLTTASYPHPDWAANRLKS